MRGAVLTLLLGGLLVAGMMPARANVLVGAPDTMITQSTSPATSTSATPTSATPISPTPVPPSPVPPSPVPLTPALSQVDISEPVSSGWMLGFGLVALLVSLRIARVGKPSE